MKITGELLKSERINKKLSVQDVAGALKLSSKIINDLEAGNIETLPSKTFVRGFVKSYAQLLKLDADMVLRQFQEEMGSTSPLPKIPPPRPVPGESSIRAPRPALKQTAKGASEKSQTPPPEILKNNDNTKKIVLMISIAVGLMVVLVISNKLISNYENKRTATLTALIPNEKVDENISTAGPVGTPPAAVATTSLAAGSADSTGVAAAASGDTTNKSSEVKTAVAPKPEPPAPKTPAEEGFVKSNGKPVEILIEAKKDTEVFYAKDSSVAFTQLKLFADQIQIIRSNTGLYLKAADGAAFKISVDGVDRGFAGSPSKEIKLTF